MKIVYGDSNDLHILKGKNIYEFKILETLYKSGRIEIVSWEAKIEEVDNFTKLLKDSVLAGIKSCLFDHGPITSSNVPSATKRIVGNIEGNIRGTITGKIKCY